MDKETNKQMALPKNRAKTKKYVDFLHVCVFLRKNPLKSFHRSMICKRRQDKTNTKLQKTTSTLFFAKQVFYLQENADI